MSVSRRTALGAGGMVGLGALLAACSGDSETRTASVPTTTGTTATVRPQSPTATATSELFPDAASCTLTPEQTEGPFYFDVDSIRSDIREDRAGTPLRLALRVRDAACAPIANAVVDVWHCDANGGYSGVDGAGSGTYLRGAQVTNAEGVVEFLTIYPGWYSGRAVHIHFKMHLDNNTVLTSQLYFDEATTEFVYGRQPYAARGKQDSANADDSLFDDSLVLTLRPDGAGYLGTMTVGVAAA